MIKPILNTSTIPLVIEETENNLNDLRKEISLAFEEKRLFKGFTEVVTAIDKRETLSKIVVVGPLDNHYHKSLIECISKIGVLENGKTKFLKLNSLKLRNLVYECIKDLEVPGTKKYNYKALLNRLNTSEAEASLNKDKSSIASNLKKLKGLGHVPKRYLKKVYESRKFFLCRIFAIKEKDQPKDLTR